MTTATIGVVALVAALLVAAIGLLRAGRRERQARSRVLDGCVSLIEAPCASIAPSGYGVLRGLFNGRPAALTPIPEALAVRKLPQLWIAAALGDEDPDRPSIEILRRPGGTESFIGSAGMPHSVRPPAGWPQDTSVRTSAGASTILAALERPLAPALADLKLKAITIGPRGVRVVRQAAQGERGAYLLFRDQRFGIDQIDVDDARAALELAALVADIIRTNGHQTDARDAA